MESERGSNLFLTRFLHANRCPLRSKTLWRGSCQRRNKGPALAKKQSRKNPGGKRRWISPLISPTQRAVADAFERMFEMSRAQPAPDLAERLDRLSRLRALVQDNESVSRRRSRPISAVARRSRPRSRCSIARRSTGWPISIRPMAPRSRGCRRCCGSYRNFPTPSFRGDAKHRTRKLEIPGLFLRTIPE
jgi:hypothetical protein